MRKISVCMATFNGSSYVERQLKSILHQLDANDEIIVSDDHSIDNTIALINNFNDKRIVVYLNEGYSGPIGNFEQAISKATGDYILLSDQDDIWLDDKVSIMRDLLDHYELVISDCIVVDASGAVIHKSFFSYRDSKPGFWRNLYKNSYVGCCMGFRSKVLTYVLPFPSTIHMHDWWIGLLVDLKGKSYFCQKPLIMYVRHGNNTSPTGEKGYEFKEQLLNRMIMLFNVLKRLS